MKESSGQLQRRCWIVLAGLVLACGGESDTADVADVTFSSDLLPILELRCSGPGMCHRVPAEELAYLQLTPDVAYEALVGAVGIAGGNWEFDERVAQEAADSVQ
jgi:hypothetical protein